MMQKNNRGISLIAMILTVIVLLIIMGTISFSSRNSYNMNKIKNFYTDIETVQEAVSVYYIKNKELPYFYVLNPGFNQYRPLTFEGEEDLEEKETPNKNDQIYIHNQKLYNLMKDVKFDDNDNQYYYAIDTRKLGNITLSNFNNIEQINFDEIKKAETEQQLIKTNKEIEDLFKKGCYIVNERSHKVYYTNPISVDGVIYYSNENSDDNIYLVTSDVEKTKGMEDIILDTEKDNMIESYYEIIYHANGGINAPSNYKIAQNKVKTVEDKKYIMWDWKSRNVTEPIRTGMTFVGWSNTPDKVITKNDIETGKVTDADIETIKNNTKFEITDGKFVELYAVWQENSDLDLEYYYPDSTGGVMLSEQDNKYSREPLGYKVKNIENNELYERPVCFDCPVSGYRVEWKGGTKLTYIAESLTTEIDLLGTEEIENNAFSIKEDSEKVYTYIVTEPGTFQLEGKFKDLHITVNDADGNSQEVTLFTSANTFEMYQTQNDKTTFNDRFKINVTLLSGKDGKFLIPKLATAYLGLGIKLPNDNINSNSEFNIDYSADDETVPYYVKSFIQNLNSSYQEFELGTVIDISDTNTDKYKVVFGCRNYAILPADIAEPEDVEESEEPKKIYEENLQNAYEIMSNLGYDTIKVLYNVNFGGKNNTHTTDNIYKLYYDPSGLDNINFYKGCHFTIDFDNKTIDRRGSIIGHIETVLLTNNNAEPSVTSGLYFSPNTLADYTEGAVSINNLTIDNNVSINLSEANAKNDDEVNIERHAVVARSSLNLISAIISSDSESLSTVWGGMRSSVYLGDENNKIIEIKNTNYYGLETTGYAYWYSDKAIIQTSNRDYIECYKLNGYNTDFYYNADETRRPCVYKGEEIYYVAINDRVWNYEENGKILYFSNLQVANDIANPESTIQRVRNIQSENDGGDTAVINKNLNIDFGNNKIDESIEIRILGNIAVNISNFNTKYSGVPFTIVDSLANVVLNNCRIEGRAAGIKNYGILNIASSTIIGSTDGIDNFKDLVVENCDISGKLDDGIENSGNLTVVSGNITGGYDGIYGKGNIILGVAETGTPKVNTNSPIITGKKNGIYNGNLKFYDGKVISESGADTVFRNVNVRERTYCYILRKTIENTKEVAFLDYGAEFIAGQEINEKMKKLAGNSANAYLDTDSNITSIQRSSSLPSKYRTDTNKVSTEASGSPIYMWYENGIIYYYSDNTKIYLNENANYMFLRLSNLQNMDVSKFDTTYTLSMKGLFREDSKLKTLNVSNWNTSKVTDMYGMFYECSGLTSLDVSRFNTSKVTDMRGMFHDCSSLKELDVSNFDITHVTSLSHMFNICNKDPSGKKYSELEYLDLSKWNTSKITEADWFLDSLECVTAEITIRGKITNYEGMFESTSKRKGQVIVNYTSATESLVDALIETQGASGNVVKGKLVN